MKTKTLGRVCPSLTLAVALVSGFILVRHVLSQVSIEKAVMVKNINTTGEYLLWDGSYGPAQGLPDEAYGGMAVSGTFLYINRGFFFTNDVHVVDISSPGSPKPMRLYDGWLHGLPASTNFHYTPDPVETWLVTDISDPAHPQLLGGYKTLASAARVSVSGQFAYRINPPHGSPNKLEVLDIGDPANPRRIGGVTAIDYPNAVAVSGHYAYVADSDIGLRVVDVSTPTNATVVGLLPISGYSGSVAVSGDHILLGGSYGIRVINVRDPGNPRLVGQYRAVENGAFGIFVSGNYAAFTSGWNVTVVNISDPGNPKFVGRGGLGCVECGAIVGISGRFVYLISSVFHVFEIRSPLDLEPLPGIVSGTFRFLLDASDVPRGVSVRLQRSNNLTDWQDWQSVTVGGIPIEVSESDAVMTPRRFYRAIIP